MKFLSRITYSTDQFKSVSLKIVTHSKYMGHARATDVYMIVLFSVEDILGYKITV